MKLYGYFRSSAAYRVRIALNLKGLAYEAQSIHLNRQGGEQFTPDFLAINPAALVPALKGAGIDGAAPLTQSLAIIEYIDEMHPLPPLLPASPQDRAWVRSLALSIACDIHPINNLRVLNYLVRDLGVKEEDKLAWIRHWCALGLGALEATLARDKRTGRFCCGDTPTLADCCLVPQLAGARRFDCDLSAMPTLLRIADNCEALEAFSSAAPARQPDAE
jgi:maleylacetoacetate isomerase